MTVLGLSTFGVGMLAGLAAYRLAPKNTQSIDPKTADLEPALTLGQGIAQPLQFNGRPRLHPLPAAQEVWECEVAVVGGSLGGIAAAAHAMQSGAQICLIEAAPWLGGQISSQGVSALDESLLMRRQQNFSNSWVRFRNLLERQPVQLPDWSPGALNRQVADINQCWVGTLCFPPKAGATAAEELLQSFAAEAPGSRWGSAIAFKGATFDTTGQTITALHAVKRTPKDPNYLPKGRLSEELAEWYSWSPTDTFDRVPIRLQPPPGKQMLVIDATDTGELVAWARVPYRVGSESNRTTGEVHGARFDNPQCTQAFTYPFAIAIHDDGGDSLATLSRLKTTFALHEHQAEYDLEGFPMFQEKSVFHYRRIVSHSRNNPYYGTPALGDISMINWNRGNDWNWMNPPLILQDQELADSGQYQNWMGGLSQSALKFGEEHALKFARWLMETQATPEYPLAYLYGPDSPMGTLSGLSMVPYFREGRRIVGRPSYNQEEFQIRENDLRYDFPNQRSFGPSAVGLVHYAIDIHGCRYRNWLPSGEAVSAPAEEPQVRPLQVPLESLVPQGVENLLIGGKALAVTHIANAVTRIHYNEWQIGAAAGATAGWLVRQDSTLAPAEIIPSGQMSPLQEHLGQQGLRLN
nr:FAD-dependent oxidoreductase [Pseudanabaena sp. FACHB-2040]